MINCLRYFVYRFHIKQNNGNSWKPANMNEILTFSIKKLFISNSIFYLSKVDQNDLIKNVLICPSTCEHGIVFLRL